MYHCIHIFTKSCWHPEKPPLPASYIHEEVDSLLPVCARLPALFREAGLLLQQTNHQ